MVVNPTVGHMNYLFVVLFMLSWTCRFLYNGLVRANNFDFDLVTCVLYV